MAGSEVRIIRLRAHDPEAPALLRGGLAVKNAGWRDTYEPWLGSAYLDGQDAGFERQAAGWTRALQDGRLMPTWVAVAADQVAEDQMAEGQVADRQVVGIAGGGPLAVTSAVRGRFAGSAEGTEVERELSVLYVLASWRGSGVAAQLAEAVLEGASACLWVLEENPRALAFYAKLGFAPDGAVEELPPEWNGAREIRLVRAAR